MSLRLGVAQGGERVGRLARLRYEERKPVRRQRRLAVAHLRGHVDLDGKARIALDPILGDQARIVGGAARRQRHALELGYVDAEVGKLHDASAHVDVACERVADDLGLLVDLLGHEVAVVALVDEQRTRHRLDERPLRALAVAVEDLNARLAQHGPVALIQIGDGVGERRQRDGIRAQIHCARAVTDGERAALAGGDHQIVVPGKDDGERKGALQALQRIAHGVLWRGTAGQLVGDDVNDDLGVGIALEHVALGRQLLSELTVVLDNAVVHDRDLGVHVRVGVALRRATVGGPARMSDAGVAVERLLQEPAFQVAQLAFGTAPLQVAVLDRGDAGGIVAAVFQPPQRIHEVRCNRLLPDDSDDAAHGLRP